jgi:hypothetical protein
MDTVLGLVGIAVWIVAVISLAAVITYVVVKLSPGDKDEKKPEPASTG